MQNINEIKDEKINTFVLNIIEKIKEKNPIEPSNELYQVYLEQQEFLVVQDNEFWHLKQRFNPLLFKSLPFINFNEKKE